MRVFGIEIKRVQQKQRQKEKVSEPVPGKPKECPEDPWVQIVARVARLEVITDELRGLLVLEKTDQEGNRTQKLSPRGKLICTRLPKHLTV